MRWRHSKSYVLVYAENLLSFVQEELRRMYNIHEEDELSVTFECSQPPLAMDSPAPPSGAGQHGVNTAHSI